MSIAKKTMILTILVLVAISVFSFYSTRDQFHKHIDNIEQIERNQKQKNFKLSLDYELKKVANRALEWAVWDDSYNFANGKKPEFLKTTLKLKSWSEISENYFVILDSQKRVLYSKEFSRDGSDPITAPKEIVDYAVANFEQLNKDPRPHFHLLSNNRLVLFGNSGIYDGKKTQASSGLFLFGLILDDVVTKSLHESTGLKFVVTSGTFELDNSELEFKLKEKNLEESTIEFPLFDFKRKGIAKVELTIPRSNLKIGQGFLENQMFNAAIVTIFILFGGVLIFQKVLTEPLQRFVNLTQNLSTQNLKPEQGRGLSIELREILNELIQFQQKHAVAKKSAHKPDAVNISSYNLIQKFEDQLFEFITVSQKLETKTAKLIEDDLLTLISDLTEFVNNA